MQGAQHGRSSLRRILRKVGEFFFLSLAVMLIPAFAYVDAIVYAPDRAELSLTQTTQHLLILITAAIIWFHAWKSPAQRGFLVLMAGFFTCMLVRELDGFLDAVFHGFWLYPALVVAFSSIAYAAIFCRGTVLQPMAEFSETKAAIYIFFGLITLLVFSRGFGSGSLIWRDIMGEYYRHEFKRTLQEGLELYGYIFLFYGSFLAIRTVRR
ncbi:hypothetical protein [Halomonas heilongjiangensis]|nr:hypothetical protein [Halomonas heilongjiangensis]